MRRYWSGAAADPNLGPPAGNRAPTQTTALGDGERDCFRCPGDCFLIKLTLNRIGQRLLKARRRLPALLTATGPVSISKKVPFV